MPPKIPNRQSTQVRIDDEIFSKLKLIAKRENRSMNSQLEYFVKLGIEAYEAEKGKINLPPEE